MNAIEARGLRKEFTIRARKGRLRRETRTVAAVDGIDLTVAPGEMVAISARTAPASPPR